MILRDFDVIETGIQPIEVRTRIQAVDEQDAIVRTVAKHKAEGKIDMRFTQPPLMLVAHAAPVSGIQLVGADGAPVPPDPGTILGRKPS